MAHSLITPSSKKNFNLDLSDHLGRGATADVYKVKIAGKYYAVKIYKKPEMIDWLKLKAITELGCDDEYSFVKTHAWPIGIIQKDSKNIGFAMELFDLGFFRTIDHYYDNMLRSKIEDTHLLALPNLILIAKNLCIELEKLHNKNIFLVDVKPQNIAINTTTNEVVILDCDGFAFEKDGDKYPAGFVSADYIAPEVTINKLSPKNLGLGQDLYALSVIIFQILNRSLHPYSGISKNDIEVSTNDDKAALGEYAYGVKSNKNIKPHVSSLHEMWDERILIALENCFTGGERTSAAGWIDIFESIERDKGYVRCEKYPKDALHIKFKDKECMQCKRDGLQATHPSPTLGEEPKPGPWTTPPTSPTLPPQVKSDPPWLLIIIIAVAAFIGLMQYFAENKEERETASISDAVYNAKTGSAASTICSPDTPEYCNSQILCSRATNTSGSNKVWVSSLELVPYALEAKRRGFSCGVIKQVSASKDVEFLSDKTLCVFATENEKAGSTKKRWETKSIYQPHVREAKKRGLDCGTKNQLVASLGNCTSNPRSCSDGNLCALATRLSIDGTNIWETSSTWYDHVKEAKERKLKCGVKGQNIAKSTCAQNPASCTTDQICKRATYSRDGNYYWRTGSGYTLHYTEAKKRGLTCGVKTSVKNNCVRNPAVCSTKELCKRATFVKNGNYYWWRSGAYVSYYNEAKKRGLTCGVNKKTATNTVQQNNNSGNLRNWTNNRICSTATKSGAWETRSIYQPHVKEAKRRGLHCGVTANSISGGSASSANLRSMSSDRLCIFASKLEKTGSSKRIWETQSQYKRHVKEAKRRGLTCGVNNKPQKISPTKKYTCNSESPEYCSEKIVCHRATYGAVDALAWETLPGLQGYVAEAKRRGLTCGVKKKANSGGSSNTASLRFMSKDTLCILASKLEKQGSTKRIWETQTKYNAHVKEAKRRGLTCGVNKKTATNTGQQNNNSGNLRNWTNNRICSTATKSGAWETRSIYQPHVKEAKRRGLHCGVTANSISGGSASSTGMRGLSDNAVCLKASFIDMQNNDIRKWNNKNAAHVKEAERRGITCGVKTKVTKVSKSCISNPKSCSDISLCKTARYGGSWEPRGIYQPHVKEAKRRGLTCDLKKSSGDRKISSKAKTKEFKARVIRNFDLYPNGFKVYSDSECIEKCLENKNCKAITFEKRTRICKLKTIQNPMHFDAGFTTIHIFN